MNNKKKLKGSGILVVILSAIAFSIYSSTVFSQAQHFDNLLNKYMKNSKNYYEKNIGNEQTYYNYVLTKINS